MVQLISILIYTLAMLAPPQPYRRASIVKSYRTCMKEKRFAQARQLIADAMQSHPEAAADATLYRLQMDAIGELIGSENRKIYLQQQPDTATYFAYISQLFLTGLQCDSVEQTNLLARQAAGKKATSRLRSTVAALLMPYRKNLVGAGKWHYRRGEYTQAFHYLDLYARTKEHPLFTASPTTTVADSDDLTEVAVLATLSAYAAECHNGVMRYLPQALHDTAVEAQLFEVGSKSAAILGDTTEMVRLLEDGFYTHPLHEYFFLTLTRYYNDLGRYDQALQKAQRMTQLQPLRRDYWYMVGKEQLLMQQQEEALYSFQQCVEIQADDAESFAAIGSIHLKQAHDAYAALPTANATAAYKAQKAAVNQFYQQARTAYEAARRFAENQPDLWLSGLREAYFKLNKGKELRALEKYLASPHDR